MQSNAVGGGTINWTIVAQGGNVSLNDGESSKILKFIGWGFEIPRDAALNGVTVTFTRSCDTGNMVSEDKAYMYNGAGTKSSDMSDHATYPTSPTAKSYGSTSNILGMNLPDVNSPMFGFGVFVSAIAP